MKSIYSTDKLENSNSLKDGDSYYENSVEIILISDRYKSLFAVHKLNAGLFKINIYS